METADRAAPHDLSSVDVDLWRLDLDGHDPTGTAGSLSPDETARARGIASECVRRRFVAGRTALRSILSGYCGVDPALVPLGQTAAGKPCLGTPFSTIGFNLSHSGAVGLLAVSSGVRIGVDLENLSRPLATPEHLAYWLHEGERRDLLDRPPSARRAAFIGLWCRKEALLKATALGLRFPLHRFRVSVPPEPAAVLSWPDRDDRWRLYDIAIAAGHEAALAIDRPVASLRLREFVSGP